MAHALRYYKEITHADGKVIRIEFHEKDGTTAAMELGDVIQSLCLEIQGGDDVDAPIIKTQLNFTLIDAPDHPDHKTKKCGAWEEFYSPVATHWKVLLLSKEQGGTFSQFWGGYITPDSFHESLTYRSGVSFIARDNIGHLNDFPFDATGNTEGMITLSDLIQTAWRKIESPMEIATKSSAMLKCEGTSALYTYMNVSAFEEKNWYEVLESALYGYGLAMRYVGENKVFVGPLRDLPYYGKDYGTIVQTVFEVGAERELTPAARRIEETVGYEIEEVITRKLAKVNEYSGAVAEVEWEGKDVFGATVAGSAKVNPLTKKSGTGWSNPDANGTLLLNPRAYNTSTIKDYLASDMLFLLNSKGNTEVVYSAVVNPQNLDIRLSFGQVFQISGTQLTIVWFDSLDKVKYAITAEQNGITQYWSGNGWVSAKTELTAAFEGGEVVLNCNARSFEDDITLGLHIYAITRTSKVSTDKAVYAALNAVTFTSAEQQTLLTTNRVNTNYIDTNNVILTREPAIAPAMNTPFVPAVIKNGIFRKDGNAYVGASLWSWNGSGAQQMAVYNHLQLLCYYGKPNNILSGTIVNADVTDFAKIYKWNNTEHIITSGVLNLISGFIENATLREFVHYDTMWGDLTDAEDFPQVDGGQTTTADAGAQSSQTATYSNTYEIRIGGEGGTIVLDTYMSDSSVNGVQNKVIKSYVDSAVDTLKTAISKRALQSDLSILESEVKKKADADKVYTKTAVDNKVLLLTEAQTKTSGRVKDIEDWKAEIASKITIKEDGVYIDGNLVATKEVSAGGAAEEGEQETQYKMYHHKQTQPSKVWQIAHYLGKMPNVKIVDSTKQLCMADVIYDNTNVVTIKFSAAESGDAYLD